METFVRLYRQQSILLSVCACPLFYHFIAPHPTFLPATPVIFSLVNLPPFNFFFLALNLNLFFGFHIQVILYYFIFVLFYFSSPMTAGVGVRF